MEIEPAFTPDVVLPPQPAIITASAVMQTAPQTWMTAKNFDPCKP
jgi:hypothetical protein